MLLLVFLGFVFASVGGFVCMFFVCVCLYVRVCLFVCLPPWVILYVFCAFVRACLSVFLYSCSDNVISIPSRLHSYNFNYEFHGIILLICDFL